jgi:hypothetical protein
MNTVIRWISSRRGIGRVSFCIFQLLSISLAEMLLPTRELSGRRFLVFAIATTALFGFMGGIAASRLLDVNWSPKWAALAVGPGALYLIFVTRPNLFRTPLSAIPVAFLALVTVVYIGMTTLLMFKGGRRDR